MEKEEQKVVLVVEAAKATGSQSSDAFWFSGINFKHIDQKRRWVRHCWTNWLRHGLLQLPRLLLLQVHSLSLWLQPELELLHDDCGARLTKLPSKAVKLTIQTTQSQPESQSQSQSELVAVPVRVSVSVSISVAVALVVPVQKRLSFRVPDAVVFFFCRLMSLSRSFAFNLHKQIK